MSEDNTKIVEQAKTVLIDTAIKEGKSFADHIFFKIGGKKYLEEKAQAEDEIKKGKELRAVELNEFEKPKAIKIAKRKLSEWEREIENQDQILKLAEPKINPISHELEQNNDLLNSILDQAKGVSDPEMQYYLSKILASEYNQPNTISKKTIQIVNSLTKVELELFTKYATLFNFHTDNMPTEFWADPVDFFKLGYNYSSDFLRLEELGLINTTKVGLPIIYENMTGFVFEGNTYFGKHLEFHRKYEQEKQLIQLNCYCLTHSGKQLLQFLDVKENPLYTEWLIEYLDKQKIIMKLT
jgi:Protein of unknown function (DUF2806)